MNIKNFFRFVSLIFVFSICTLIFLMSSKNGTASNNISGSFIRVIINFLNRDFENLPKSEQLLIIESCQFFVRKTAHFSIFAALGFFAVGFLNTYINFRYLKSGVFSLIFVFLYAVSDEIHQLFTLDRSGQISDVIIDTCGGIFGIVIMSLIFKTFLKIMEGKRLNGFKKQQ